MVTTSKAICEKSNMSITGATLLSVEEAQSLPDHLRKYDKWYWLRSSCGCRRYATFVHFDGAVSYSGGFVSYDGGCVRPALMFEKVESSDLQIGDKFEFGGKEFEIVSDNLAFCASDIGCYAFRKNWAANNANDYDKSDVKKFVDKWLKNAAKE